MQSLDVLHLTLGQVKSIRWSELPSTIGLLMVKKRLKCIKIGLWLQGANFEVLHFAPLWIDVRVAHWFKEWSKCLKE